MNDEDCYHIDDLTEDDSQSIETSITPKYVAGILQTHQTFGLSKNGKKYLYKVVPFDASFPSCLIPYEVKIEFNKKPVNKFILFEYTDEHVGIPSATLVETIGNEDDLDAYFEYLLYAKRVNPENRDFNKQMKSLQTKVTSINNHFDKFEFFREKIISIDNVNTEFFDDALHFRRINEHTVSVSVFIANVPGWLEHLDLWRYIYNMKTIYLQNKRHLMFPRNFTKMCSLQENEMKNAVQIQYTFVEVTYGKYISNEPPKITVNNICVSKNHVYDSDALKSDAMYQSLFDFSKKMDSSIVDSRELVRYWMVHCNKELTKMMKSCDMGVYKPFYDRKDNESLVKTINTNVRREHNYYTKNKNEDYAQFTCPIRRIVDVINLTTIINDVNFPMGNSFIKYWLSILEDRNEMMIDIRKIENKCYLMNLLKNFEDGIEYEATFMGNNIIHVPSLNRLFHIKEHSQPQEITKCKIYVIKHSIYIQCF